MWRSRAGKEPKGQMEGLASVPRAKACAFVGLREGLACPTS